VVEGQATDIDALDPSVARANLQSLLDAFVQTRAAAIPFMPKAGYRYFQQNDASRGWQLARKEWNSDFGEGQDPWVRLALRGADPFRDDDQAATQQFKDWSLRVFGALPGAAGGAEPADD
jgi:exonuclease V gamma subunit